MDTVEIDTAMLDALRSAETLARGRPDGYAVIYSRQGPDRVVSGRMAPGSAWLEVLPESDPAPLGARLVTTVTRKPRPAYDAREMTLAKAVRQVASNLPAGVVLHPQVVVERFPARAFQSQEPGVFAYQFISTEMRNVATWMPPLTEDIGGTKETSVMMQMGFDGRGRPWDSLSLANVETRDIQRWVDGARTKEVPPGECSDDFAYGWRLAEERLRAGGSPDDDGPDGEVAYFNGFIGRMAHERVLRAEVTQDVNKAAPRRAAP